MIVAQVDMTGFNLGMIGLIKKAKLNAKTVVRKETGELIKTLVRTSPPADRKKSQDRAEQQVRKKFTALATGGYRDYERTHPGGGISKTGVKWYYVDEHFLRGVAPQSDMRKASHQTVYRIFRKANSKGRIIVPFKHPRKRQRVMISTKLLVTKRQIGQVVAHVKRNFGRLKAAWLVAVTSGVIPLTGSGLPPRWVSVHAAGARGAFINGLSNGDKPNFTIINRAKGIGQRTVNFLVQRAVNIRAKAMKANTLLFTKGKKHLSDYR